MIYLDTSSLLKLVLSDEQSVAVEEAVLDESMVVVSSLTQLEAYVQLKGQSRSGSGKTIRLRQAEKNLAIILGSFPFTSRLLHGRVFACALDQHRRSKIHCRSLDRLHLAAMDELGVVRLMTHDARQADAAHELGYTVIMPGSR